LNLAADNPHRLAFMEPGGEGRALLALRYLKGQP
jgi:hypothetical protein